MPPCHYFSSPNLLWQVIVGSNGTNPLQFNPNSIAANISDTVTFVFNVPGTNHTVAQSLFAKPCEPAAGGFASGYIPGDATNPGKFTLNITDTKREYPLLPLSRILELSKRLGPGDRSC